MKNITNEKLLKELMLELGKTNGDGCDEMQYVDVQKAVITAMKNTLHSESAIFLTQNEREQMNADELEMLKREGKNIIIISNNIAGWDGLGSSGYSAIKEYLNQYQYNIICYTTLTEKEKQIYDNGIKWIDFCNSILKPRRFDINDLKLADNIKNAARGQILGLANINNIILSKKSFGNQAKFNSVLIHELVHFCTRTSDATREFESILTDVIGELTLLK